MTLFSKQPGRRAVRLLALTGVALALGCGTTDAPDPLAPTGPVGRIRFVNLITDPARNPVNAILEGLPFGVNLAYTASTPASLPAPATAIYSPIYSGARTLVLRRTADTSVVVATINLNIAADVDHTVFATGGAGGGAVAGFTVNDNNAAPAAGQARVRVVNMSPTAGAIDVFFTAAGADLSAATPFATNVAHQAQSAYGSLAPGTYQFRAVPAGTAPAARNASVTITQSGIALASGNARSVVTADNTSGGTPLRAFVLSDR